MPSQNAHSNINLPGLLTLQGLLTALLAYLVIRTHENFPEEKSIFFTLKLSLLALFMMLIALNALA